MTATSTPTQNTQQIDEKALTYLQMVQGNIERMSTSSALFKGFAATIVSGISALAFSEINFLILVMSFIPVLSFMIMDLYYLKLERQYRFLYEEIRTMVKPIDFSLALNKLGKNEKKKAKIRFQDLISSPSIYLFYPILIIICGVVIFLKIQGII